MLLRRFLFTFFCLCQLLIPQATVDEAKVWGDFLEWLKKQPAVAASELISEYKPKLIASGLSEAQAGQYISIIQRLAKERRLDLVASDFDRIYVNDAGNFSKAPNAFLAGVISDLKPGRALDVSMGQGRNAVFLAEKGWDVTGYDVATEGLRLARERAQRSGLKITAIRATHQDFDFGQDRWDLVVMTYSWAPMNTPEFIQRIYDSLKAGGLVLAEDNEGSLYPRPTSNNFLLKWFESFRILRYELANSGGEWGNPKNAVYRFLAQKP
jgi:SAM-dependent methyltransferase